RRMRGWWYYYFVTLGVKVPLAFWALVATRAGLRGRVGAAGHGWVLPAIVGAFLAVTGAGGARKCGYRYQLPLAPLGGWGGTAPGGGARSPWPGWGGWRPRWRRSTRTS